MSQALKLPILNLVTFAGRLVADPHPLKAAGDREGSAMTVAINRPNGKGGKPVTTFVDVIAFGDVATACNKFLAKGSAVLVSGSLQTYERKRDKGPAQKVLQVGASAIQFLNSAPEKDAADSSSAE